ncbi:MAG TPA: zinc-binding dehydrogenase, partial [Gemmatimonadales bacterium]|nr:zinc-binding dehydrogenase [Gemmatimonadales bacterium]
MKAIQLVETGAPVVLRDIPEPSLGPSDVLVRVRAAGICHSDAHYRAGRSPAGPLPLTLGHEVAGVVERVGAEVKSPRAGDRVCVHYLISCGGCPACVRGDEQFCATGAMIGHHRAGGWAEVIAVPARNAVALPSGIPFAHGAVAMCSSATALHALKRGRLGKGDRVAVFGIGGLGMSAVQLARALGAVEVFAVDLDERKLKLAEAFGAVTVHAGKGDPVGVIRDRTGGRGVDVALELIGLPLTMEQSLKVLAVHGRAVVAGLAMKPMSVDSYRDLLGREAELLGANDHLKSEMPGLLELIEQGSVNLERVVERRVPPDAG